MLMMVTRPSYQDVYQRSYGLEANVSSLNKLEAVLHNSGCTRNMPLANNVVASTIPEMVKLEAIPIGIAQIANGWGTQRIRFLLEIESDMNSAQYVSYIQGYSEYYDPSLQGTIDPNMKFFINSITNVQRFVHPGTMQYETRLLSTYNVITDSVGGNRYQEINDYDDIKLIRPKDIIDTISSVEMYSDHVDTIVNAVGGVAGRVNTSTKVNNNPINYFTGTINSYIEAKNLTAGTHDPKDIYRRAAGIADESAIVSVPFIFALHTMNPAVISPADFTLNMLRHIGPNLQQVTTVLDSSRELSGNRHKTMLDSDVTSPMMQPTAENMKANTIAQTVASIMTECLLSEIEVSFSNLNGMSNTYITKGRSFIEGIDVTAFLAKAESNLKHILFPMVTDSGMTLMEVNVKADILGDTTIIIALYPNPPIVFRFPTFADSLFIPILSTSAHKAGTVEDFTNIIDMVTTNNDIVGAIMHASYL